MTEKIRKYLGSSLQETASLFLLSTSMVGAIEQRRKNPGHEMTALLESLHEQIRLRLARKPSREALESAYRPGTRAPHRAKIALDRYRRKLAGLRKKEQAMQQKLEELLDSVFVGEALAIDDSFSSARHRRNTLKALHRRQLVRLQHFPMDQLRILQAEIAGLERTLERLEAAA